MTQKIRLTVAPQVKERLQRNQSHGGYDTQLSFYVKPAFAEKVNQLAARNKRSVSSVLAEMVEFAMDRLDSDEAELDQEPSAMHPRPLSYNDVPAKRSNKVTLRMTAVEPDPTSADISAQTLSRIGADVWPDATQAATQAYKNNLRGKGYYVKDDEE